MKRHSIISFLLIGAIILFSYPSETAAKVDERPVYITIDDGPTVYTDDFLDVFKQYDMKATFFMLEPGMDRYNGVVRRMKSEGHALGCHGVTHEKGEFYESPSSAVNEMNMCNSTMEEITGQKTSVVRVPYGSIPGMEKPYREAMEAAGYKMWDWNVDTLDWDWNNEDKIISYTIEKVEEAERKGEIPVILFHDQYETLKALPEILEYLKSEGYYSETITSYQDKYNFFQKINLEAKVANRFGGSTRYDTAIEISKDGWDYTDTVVLTRGDEFPDALAGSPLAYQMDAPILLTPQNELLPEVRKEMDRLNASRVVVLGGKNAISEGIEKNIKALGYKTERISGADRFETAAEIAERLDSNAKTAVVANGRNFPDAISIAPYAAIKGYPILLTEEDELPGMIQEALKGVSETLVIGGESAVGNSVSSQLVNPERYSGDDRFGTAGDIAERLFPSNFAFVSTGYNFADALTGSVLAAKKGAGMLLVEKSYITAETANAVERAGINNFTILGGEGAVDYNVERWFENYNFDSIRAAANTRTLTK
ncbi:cell wall-binding repeat-containing protein [Rossellomorea aquimaris]|uniref:Polysaccharide deacetylase family protein n=1 Tax=Rossellomorea aquimaris TaxID=189382 RepID=A0A5D4TUJ7_9BACI|nr:cell wall-binding repeat-containing protein [Rossellomorea aquimaris]TYS78501.1 polysaccharide deacetylase family protein [Rossellomorea aquimaris]